MSSEQIKQTYDTLIALVAEYEEDAEKATLDGFTLWLVRKRALGVKRYRENIKRKVLGDSLGGKK